MKDEIKKKIEEQVKIFEPNFGLELYSGRKDGFRHGAEYGYTLAQEELKEIRESRNRWMMVSQNQNHELKALRESHQRLVEALKNSATIADLGQEVSSPVFSEAWRAD